MVVADSMLFFELLSALKLISSAPFLYRLSAVWRSLAFRIPIVPLLVACAAALRAATHFLRDLFCLCSVCCFDTKLSWVCCVPAFIAVSPVSFCGGSWVRGVVSVRFYSMGVGSYDWGE